VDDPRQALGEVSKQFVEIAVRGDRLCDLQQGFVPLSQRLTGG
jgi:hypothetical protein